MTEREARAAIIEMILKKAGWLVTDQTDDGAKVCKADH